MNSKPGYHRSSLTLAATAATFAEAGFQDASDGPKGPEFKLEDFLFPEQLKFVQDPAPNKVAVCSRRSGKTMSCCADLIHTALSNPGVVCLYITLRRNNAKRIIWKELKRINRQYNLGGDAHETDLSITFPNESVIYLSGAKDTNEIENFRGMPVKLCYIDECQSFRSYLRDLIDDVIAPTLMDYAGTLCLIGTPGPVPVGYFAEVAGVVKGRESAGDAWSKHAWTFFDNPFITKKSGKTHDELLQRELKRRGVGVDDPSIQREFFGRWVHDTDSLLLHYETAKNHVDMLPLLPNGAKWNYIMGVDLGFSDSDALAVIAWSEHTPATFLVDEIVTDRQGITELVEQIEELRKTYPVSKIVMDTGGLGLKIAEEIRRQHKIPVLAADKKLKMQNVAFLNDALRTSRFKARHDSKFAQDCFLVEIDRDKTTPERLVVSDKYHSDIIDAVLYAFKESPAFAYVPPKEEPKPGTKEWGRRQQEQMFEDAQKHFEEMAEMRRRYGG